MIIIEYFCNSPCDDYFNANSTILTARVLSKIVKIVTSSFAAEDTNICGEKAHSTVSNATSWGNIKEDEGHQTLSFHHKISVELKNAADNEESRA